MNRPGARILFVSGIITACLGAACAPSARDSNVSIGMDEGGSGGGGRGGSGGNASGGAMAGAMPGTGGDKVDANADTAAAVNDAAAAADVAPKLDAAPRVDAASPAKAVLVGEAMNCNAAAPAPGDVAANFEGAVVETVAVGDRTPAAPAQLITDGTAGTITSKVMAEVRCGSTKSSVFSGSGFTFWGAVVAIDFKGPVSPRQFYNASRYKGIQLYARAAAPTSVRLKISDRNNARWGGVCTADKNCDDYWGRQLQLGPEWKLYYLAFNDLDTQRMPVFGPFVATETTGIEFVMPANTAFEMHVDDIAFVP